MDDDESLSCASTWSPEQFSGWVRLEHDKHLSHESIYLRVWADKNAGGDLYSYLRRRGNNGKTSRDQIKNRVSISERPAVVDEKIEVGYWEIDTVIGKGHKGVLVTIVERVTKFTRPCKVDSKSAAGVTTATIKCYRTGQIMCYLHLTGYALGIRIQVCYSTIQIK